MADSAAQLRPVLFGTGFGGITDLKVGPDGLLYVASFGDGAIYRIAPAAPALAFGKTSLPDAEAGAPYDVDLQISGGTAPYSIAPIGGSLPGGIAPNSHHLSGTPNAAKTFKFTLRVTDDDGATVSRPFSIRVLKALAVSTQSLKNGKAGRTYKGTLKAAGGKAPYTWTLKSGGALPSGLSLSSSGAITGVPAGPSSGNLTFQVTDGLNVTAEKTLSLTITN